MRHQVVEAAARLHDLGRQAVQLDIALVADHDPLVGIKQQQALRDVVDGDVEPLSFQRLEPLRLTQFLVEILDVVAMAFQRVGGAVEHRIRSGHMSPEMQRRYMHLYPSVQADAIRIVFG